MQDGAILVWKFNVAANCFEPAASLKGHTRGVVSLVVGANRLYSGSMDNTVRVSLHNLIVWYFVNILFKQNGSRFLIYSLHLLFFSGVEP